MKFYQISPQTAGSLGDGTIIEDINSRPVKISKLEFEVNFWPENDLVSVSYAAYAGTERLAQAIKASKLAGVEFSDLSLVEGDQFWIHKNEHPKEILPKFLWFRFTGTAGVDDFGLIQAAVAFPLVVSERALVLLKSINFKLFRIKDFDPSLQVTQS